jgi:uncharacterized protein YbjT (DUF2867 family)
MTRPSASDHHRMPDRLVLLTGATGYVGGRLLEALEARGETVRCMARRPMYLRPRVGRGTTVVAGDVLEPQSLEPACAGVHTAYYLVHSMGAGGEFSEQDRIAAENFGRAAAAAKVRRIIYLGGLGHGNELSTHLASRQETGRVLAASGVPTVELRTSIIIGSGSLSFELVRALVDRLPVMTTPRWVRTPTQPIAIEDVVAYLVAAFDLAADDSRTYEIGGADVVSYGSIMEELARQRGLRRLILPVPVLTPGLSSLWLGLVTPVYARVGRELIEGLRNPTIVRDDRALRDFPIRPRGVREAIGRAIVNEDREFAATRWSDALSSTRPAWGGEQFGSRLVDSRAVTVDAPPAAAFAPIRRLGGRAGWYHANWAWRLRGWLDLLVGGVGLRRGRRDPEHLRPGDTLDWWRVEAVEADALLRLSAEMRLPGRAWLQFEVVAGGDGRSTIRQTALFDPAGLVGRLYWYLLWPLHQYVFAGMLRGIARRTAASALVLPEYSLGGHAQTAANLPTRPSGLDGQEP